MDTTDPARFAPQKKHEGKAAMARMVRKKKPSGAKQDGPYLAAAVLCERVIRDEDKSLTVVRIIDRVTFQVPAGILSSGVFSLGAALFQACMFVMFRSGNAKGKRKLILRAFAPDGNKFMEDLTVQVIFDGKGETNTVAQIQIGTQFRMEGLHWFHLFLDDRPLTRIPLRVAIQHQTTSASPGPVAKKR